MGALDRIAKALSQVRSPSQSLVKLGEAIKEGGGTTMNEYIFNESTMTPEGMVSVSQLQTYMGCPKKWAYSYIERLTPRIDRPYLTIGKLCHKGMQVAMNQIWLTQQQKSEHDDTNWFSEILDKAKEAMVDEWEEYINSHPFLAEEMPEQTEILDNALSVFAQAFEEFEPWRYEVYTIDNKPALELHFVVPCVGTKGLHGFIDAILIDKYTGYIWCTDYKFRKQLAPEEEEITNIQNAVYTYACSMLGVPITGTMTWQHINTPVATPVVNKNGTISRAKIKTTWAKYAKFCTEHNQDPELYREEMEPKLNDNKFFQATYENRNPIFVENIWKGIVEPSAVRVSVARTGIEHIRYMYPWNCKMCQFKDLCQAELRNHDADFLRKTEYMTRESVNRVIDNDDNSVV